MRFTLFFIILFLFACNSKEEPRGSAILHQEEAKRSSYGQKEALEKESKADSPELIESEILVRSEKQNPNASKLEWKTIDEGLFLAEIESSILTNVGDNVISILKIDPKHYSFKLVSAKELKTKTKTVKDWSSSENLIAAFNAGMYQTDYATNVGYMKNYEFVNNRRFNKDNTIIAFNPKQADLPEVQIIDRSCQDWESLLANYHSATQGIRMIDCQQKNTWAKREQFWSIIFMAMDKSGNVLFIFSRSPYRVHDMVNMVLDMPLDIKNAMYLEGGPEASFYLNHKGTVVEKFGSFETGFISDNNNNTYWPIPNIIGVVKK